MHDRPWLGGCPGVSPSLTLGSLGHMQSAPRGCPHVGNPSLHPTPALHVHSASSPSPRCACHSLSWRGCASPTAGPMSRNFAAVYLERAGAEATPADVADVVSGGGAGLVEGHGPRAARAQHTWVYLAMAVHPCAVNGAPRAMSGWLSQE